MATDSIDQKCDGEPDDADMTVEEIEAWIEANSPPLTAFSLDNHEGRLGFLRELFMRGYPALFEGVSHLWKYLEEPKAQRCFGIGLAAGTGGTGKAALVKFLAKMIDEGLKTFSSIPPIDRYPSLDAWNEAVKQGYRDDEAKLSVLLNKYAQLLVANPFDSAATIRFGHVIQGPWIGKEVNAAVRAARGAPPQKTQ